MAAIRHCPECGAGWQNGLTCRDHFDQMLAWEFEDFSGVGAVHNLTVLCYNLQHPSAYSAEGLILAKQLLTQFVVDGISPQHVRQRNRKALDSGNRAYKITGTPESHGVYAHPVSWTTTVGEIAAGGLDGYCDRVRVWASSIYEALKCSGNLAPS